MFVEYILIFFFYSIVGWLIEVTLKGIQYKRFINRGFLAGPLCPIYGAGGLLITLAVNGLSSFERSYATTFLISFLLCSIIEYMTSFFQEKFYNARWWDYSQKPLNLNGRVWIGNLVLFGLGGIAIIHFINPIFYDVLSNINADIKEQISIYLMIVFVVDSFNTYFILKLIKTEINHCDADNTEEIRKEIRFILRDKNAFYRRFVDAYPEIVYRTERIKRRLENIRLETEKFIEQKEQDYKDLSKRLETTHTIKNRIIDNQNQLISLLYDEISASDDMKKLKGEIDIDMKNINDRAEKYNIYIS